MKIIKYMQEGGAVPTAQTDAAPVDQGAGQDPLMQISELFMNGLQNGDCNMLAQGAEMFLSMLQQAMGQGGPQGPVDQVPQGSPVFRKGGKLIKRKKCDK